MKLMIIISLVFLTPYFRMNDIQTRFTSDTDAFRTGPGTGHFFNEYHMRMEINTIESATLQGTHQLTDNFNINWSAVYSTAYSLSPDAVTYEIEQTIFEGGSRTPHGFKNFQPHLAA